MLIAKPRVSEQIIQGIRQKNTLLLLSQAGTIRFIPMSDCAVRIILSLIHILCKIDKYKNKIKLGIDKMPAK